MDGVLRGEVRSLAASSHGREHSGTNKSVAESIAKDALEGAQAVERFDGVAQKALDLRAARRLVYDLLSRYWKLDIEDDMFGGLKYAKDQEALPTKSAAEASGKCTSAVTI